MSEDPLWKRAVGRCPQWTIQVDGVEVVATVDSGSQVTTLSEAWFRKHLSGRRSPNADVRWLRLSAANGQTIDSVGFLILDLLVKDQLIPDCPVIIIRPQSPSDHPPDCLLGMNVIQRHNECPEWLKTPTLPELDKPVHSLRKDTLVPAQSVMHIDVTAGDPSLITDAILEPAPEGTLGGLSTMPVFTKLQEGRLRIPVVNNTERDIILPARAFLGRVVSAQPVERPTVHLLTAEVVDANKFPDNPRNTDHKETRTGSNIDSIEEKIKRIDINPDLHPSQVEQLRDILHRYEDCFAWSDTELGYTDQVKHEIFLTDDTPIAQPYRRIPPAVLGKVKEHIQDLISRKIISPSSSPYAAPIVVAQKKNGDIRLCVDYRRLNAVTRKDSFPLPRIDESLDALCGSKFFSTLDLASGYYQVAMAERDKHKTAFVCPFGLYEFNRMSFGLCNAPSTFQRLMNQTMSDFMWSILLVYLDDLLIYTPTFDKHLIALELVLGRLRLIGVRLNPDKCHFAYFVVKFLGHLVSAEGVATDPDKVEAVRNWPEPKTVKDVRSFLGLASYYRRFVKDFAKIAGPLNGLYKKVHETYPNDMFKGERKQLSSLWTPECQEAFLQLKLKLTTAPVLGHPDFSLPFLVEIDASFVGLGAVLSQQQQGKTTVIAYASRTLRLTEKEMRNYSSRKLELLGMKWAVAEKYRNYLLCHSFTVLTDNNPLSHMSTGKFSAVELRWIAEINSVGDMTVDFKPGRLNRNADALSRNPVSQPDDSEDDWTAISAIQAMSVQEYPQLQTPTPLLDEIFCGHINIEPTPDDLSKSEDPHRLITAQHNDPAIANIIPFVSLRRKPNNYERNTFCDETKKLLRVFDSLTIQEGLLMRHWMEPGTKVKQLVVVAPISERKRLFQLAHSRHGHQGAERTYQLLRRRCFWPGMLDDVSEMVKRCERCQPAKKATIGVRQQRGHIIANQPLEILALDFLTVDQAADGTEHLLVMTDVFTKFAVAVPTCDQSATTVVEKLIHSWILHYGVPLRIHSDQGRAFESEVVRLLCHHYGIKKSRSTAYHPAGNGQCERFNRSLLSLLTTLDPSQKPHWPKYLAELVYYYNSTPHSTTGLSPYALLFGREPRLPLDVALGIMPARSYEDDHVLNHIERLNALRNRARENTFRTITSREQPSPARSVPLKVGDQVLLLQHKPGRCKIADRYSSTPATILRIPSEVHGSFTIRFPDERVFERHGSQLKRYLPSITSENSSKMQNEVKTSSSDGEEPTERNYITFQLRVPPNEISSVVGNDANDKPSSSRTDNSVLGFRRSRRTLQKRSDRFVH